MKKITVFLLLLMTFFMNANNHGAISGNLETAALVCNMPSNPIVSNITQTTALLSWMAAGGTGIVYNIYLATTNTPPTTNSSYADSSTNSFLLEGLIPGKTYYYWIRTVCSLSERSLWIAESFSTSPIPGCTTASFGQYPSGTFAPTCNGNQQQIVNNAYAGEYANVTITAEKYYTFKSSKNTDHITITDASGEHVLKSGQTPLQWFSGSTSGIIRYYFHTNASCGEEGIDRTRYISCNDSPGTCGGIPGNVTASPTMNSVTLNWTAPATLPADGYQIYVSTSATVPSYTTTFAGSTTTSFALGGLSTGSVYYYRVRSVCGDLSYSSWVTGSFTTLTPPPTTGLGCTTAVHGLYPSATFTPTCGSAQQIIVDNAWAGEYTNVTIQANRQYTLSSSVGTDFITITNSTATVIIAYGTSPLVWNSGANSGVLRYYLHASSQCDAQNSLRTRYIKCTTDFCLAPSNVSSYDVTAYSAKISWTPPSPAPISGHQVYVSDSFIAPVSATVPTGHILDNYTTFTVYGLDYAKVYYFWVRSNCGAFKSDWVAGGMFTTLPAPNCLQTVHPVDPYWVYETECNGVESYINSDAYVGDYTNVAIQPSRKYTFRATYDADYITISNAIGTIVYAQGGSPLVWDSGTLTGVVRFALYYSSDCSTGSTSNTRKKYITCEPSLGIDEVTVVNKESFILYPNPSQGQFTVDTGSVIADTITVFDGLGRAVIHYKPVNFQSVLDGASFASGIYYVKVQYGNKILSKKLVLGLRK